METRGVLQGIRDGIRPFSREKFAKCILLIQKSAEEDPSCLTPVDMRILNRLKGEFSDELQGVTVHIPKDQFEPHFYTWSGKPGYFHLDGILNTDVFLRDRGMPTSESRIYSVSYGGILRGAFRDLGFYSDNRIFEEWGSRKYQENYKASMGYPNSVNRDSSLSVWDITVGYLVFSIKGIRFQFGRDNIRWGPAYWGGLMFSGMAPAFDLLKITAETGPFSFAWFHGSLRSDFTHKWISAHRLEVSILKNLDLGFSESVIYGNRGLEPAYLNPLIPYLVAEHTLGDKDNVSMGLDFDYHGIRNLKIYGDFFIDDLFSPMDIFSDFYGNKVAFTTGGFWTDPLGLNNSSIRLEYTRIEPYVYTHEDTVNVYENYNVGLGHFLQPNSDALTIGFIKQISLQLKTGFLFQWIRHGEGNRRTPHRKEEGDTKKFLSGIVERKQLIGFDFQWELRRDLWLKTGINRIHEKNTNHLHGADKNWTEIFLSFHLNW
jgi:hypothetical protein